MDAPKCAGPYVSAFDCPVHDPRRRPTPPTEAALRAPAPVADSGWRDISTAPRVEDAAILVWHDDGWTVARYAEWDFAPEHLGRVRSGTPAKFAGWVDDNGDGLVPQPTRFWPLPPAPPSPETAVDETLVRYEDTYDYMRPATDGEWVRYEDARAALATAQRHDCEQWRADAIGCTECRKTADEWYNRAHADGVRAGLRQAAQMVQMEVDRTNSNPVAAALEAFAFALDAAASSPTTAVCSGPTPEDQ